MRIEYIVSPILSITANDAPDKPSFQIPNALVAIGNADVRPDWAREFTALGRHTLEQISELIQQVVGWDGNHLYEFRIADRVHAHLIFLEEDDLFVDTSGPTVSCDIPIKLLGLTAGDIFTYIFDFSANHVFRVTLLEIRPSIADEIVPSLISSRGRALSQYCFDETTPDLEDVIKIPTVVAPAPTRDRFRFRIRFISNTQECVVPAPEIATADFDRFGEKCV